MKNFPAKEQRISKIIARAGICSRRDAEKLILAGAVSIAGKVITNVALNILPDAEIYIHGKKVPVIEEKRLWLYYKPLGLVTSHKDEKGRKTIFDALPQHLPRLISVGRLDMNTEGLILLTNSGELSRYLELPSTGWKRKYRARIYGLNSFDTLQSLIHGITIDGVRYGSIEVIPETQKHQGRNLWVSITLTEGKNREIRKVFEHFGCSVSRLIRVSYGPFQIGKLASGEIKEVPRKTLMDQLGNILQ